MGCTRSFPGSSATVPPFQPPALPDPRGPLSRFLIDHLRRPVEALAAAPEPADGPLGGDDFHLSLYVVYELSYRSFAGVDPDWEWEPTLIALRATLEGAFEAALRDSLPAEPEPVDDVPAYLAALLETPQGPSLSRFLEMRATLDQFLEFVVHRSAYQLKEADPHSFAIARLEGRSKVALVEIQADEYGGGRPARQHARLFADAMEALGLDRSYGAYLDRIPGVTLATVNLMSMFALRRRWRGAIVGHLALLEMDSTQPNRRYGNALRRLGRPDATEFFDEHVEADAVHEEIAAHDLAGALAADDPAVAPDIIFGARAMLLIDKLVAHHVLGSWERGETSLRAPLKAAPVPV
jgi:Iron-containing redox enzyme